MLSTERDAERKDAPPTPGLRALAIKGGGFSILAETVQFVVHTLGVLILARLLDPRAFGLTAMVSVFFLLLMNVGVNGFTEYIVQKESISQTELSNIFWVHMTVGVVLTLAFNAVATILARFYKEPLLVLVVRALSLGIILNMLSTYPVALLQRRMSFFPLALNRVVAGASSVALAIVLAVMGAGYWAIVARQLADIALMTLGAWILCPFKPRLPKEMYSVGRAVKYATRVYGNYLIGSLGRTAAKVMLGRFLGPSALGLYDRAHQLSSMPVAQLVTPLNSVGLATLSRLRSDPERFKSYYKRALSTLTLIGVYASVVLALSGKDLILVLLGAKWQAAGPIVQAFSFGIAPMVPYATYSWLHLSLGRPERWLRWSAVAAAFTVACLVGVVRFGPVAVAGAYSLSYYVLLLPAILYAGRPVGLRVLPVVREIVPYFVCGVITCTAWIAPSHLSPGFVEFLAGLTPLVRAVLAVLAASVLYPALVVGYFRSPKPVVELVGILGTFISRKRDDLKS